MKRRAEHRRVIDQDGNDVHDRPSGLRAVLSLIRNMQGELEMDPPRTGPDDLAGVALMPHTVHRIGDLVREGFRQIDRDMDALVQVLSAGWWRMAGENDMRMRYLDERLEHLAVEHRRWTARQDGMAMAEAYAEGGTELVQKLTPELLAAMDARAKGGAA